MEREVYSGCLIKDWIGTKDFWEESGYYTIESWRNWGDWCEIEKYWRTELYQTTKLKLITQLKDAFFNDLFLSDFTLKLFISELLI